MSKSKPIAKRAYSTVINDTKRIAGRLGKNIKTLFPDIRRSYQETLADFKERFKTLSASESARKDFVTRILLYSFISLLLAVALYAVSDLETGAAEEYLNVIIPVFIITEILIFFCELFKSNSIYTIICVALIYFGVSIQLMIKHSTEKVTKLAASTLVLHATVGVVAAVLLLPLLSYLTKKKLLSTVLSILGSGGFYAILTVLKLMGKSSSGTTAWVNIGGFSLQLTELTKILFVLSIALIFSHPTISDKRKVFYSTAVFLFHTAFLFLTNEFGTLVVMFLVFIVYGLIYLKSVKKLAVSLLAIAIIAAGGVALCNSAYNACYHEAYGETKSDISSLSNIFEEQTPEEILAIRENEKQYVTVDEEGNTVNPLIEYEKAHPVQGTASKIYRKLYNRLAVMLNYEKYKDNDNAYQVTQAKKQLLVSDLLGNNYHQNVPVIESDYVFLYVISRMGAIVGIIVIFMLIAMFLATTPVLLKRNDRFSAFGFGLVGCQVIQSLISAGNAICIIPTVGVPFAFLSLGGTSTMINFITVLFIIYALKDDKKTVTAGNKEVIVNE